MKLVVGLGNPGQQYATTRHNLGWQVLDALASRLGAGEWQQETDRELDIAEVRLGEERVLLVKPTTFMNNSGRAVAGIAKYYKIAPEDVLLIHDELDLPLGTIRLRLGGSAAGHHGVESVAHHLGTDQFWRLRCGIAPASPLPKGEGSRFVLASFLGEELQLAGEVVDRATSLVHDSLVSGILTEVTATIPRVGDSN